MKVIIAGGSIAGLAAALTLDCIGHDVEICERSVMSLRGQGGGVAGHAPPHMRLHHKRFTLDAAMLSRPECRRKRKSAAERCAARGPFPLQEALPGTRRFLNVRASTARSRARPVRTSPG
ncbi:hypothetical protein CA602_08835 [Paraburkholderia hospita]|nr:hypothetical protein CA602_08835 [Paraburkholderia hospita]